MAYNPFEHTVSNKSYGLAQAAPTDARSFYLDTTLFIYRPYQSTLEVLAYLDNSTKRTGNFPIFIHTGSLNGDGTFTGGEVVEYWFKDGTTDGHLIQKQNGGGGFTTVPTYADLVAATASGIYKVSVSEVNNSETTFYIKDGDDIYWVPTSKMEI